MKSHVQVAVIGKGVYDVLYARGEDPIGSYVKAHGVYFQVIGMFRPRQSGDIAIGLRTPAHEAERIKQKYGCALSSMVNKEDTLEVPSVGGRQPRVLGRQILSEILEPRVEVAGMALQ